jgi:sugar phosphate isomerase/epimerase
MLTHHRFADGPPLEERKAAIARNLGELADAVAPDGFTLAVENHCDWRGHEIVDVVKAANRPNLKMQLDTGNAFSVFEDPVECARMMAPWVVSVHLKDIRVTPFATGEVQGIRGVSVPLGEGHVDNAAICDILQQHAPNPSSIPLLIEPFYIPRGADVTAFFETSVAWAKRALSAYLQ